MATTSNGAPRVAAKGFDRPARTLRTTPDAKCSWAAVSRPSRQASPTSWTSGDTSRLNVVGDGDERDALGALIGRKGERLSALQHLVNLMLSRRMGGWTRVLVDVEDYRGRRERQLRDLALRAAARVVETGKMLQLEPMPALERRWVHIALRDNGDVVTQSIGEEPNRRVVVLPRGG